MLKPTAHQVFSLMTGGVMLFPVWLESRKTSGAENCNLLMENEVLPHCYESGIISVRPIGALFSSIPQSQASPALSPHF